MSFLRMQCKQFISKFASKLIAPVAASITERGKFSVNYVLQLLAGSLPENYQANQVDHFRACYRKRLAVH